MISEPGLAIGDGKGGQTARPTLTKRYVYKTTKWRSGSFSDQRFINLSDISENIRKEEHSKIMQSLSSTNFWGKQVDLFRRAQKGSGQWILEDKRLKSWLTEHPKTCWCKGEAGAGKTFLSAIIIDYLSFSMKNKNIGIAWLYVDYRERDSHTLENFYANLLLQLFKQTGGLSKSMMKSLGSKREEAKPSAAEYKSWLQEEVQKFDRTIIIIDALMKCVPKSSASSSSMSFNL